ncbi:helix-turn-helix transcriptional regulator [Peptostreptococcus sp. D1]|uniref:helix-turn-helix transcriptional regulator n=1 Tax=Peptostreptococcus sp. D1 TaxID=72304 RepID=UPI0008E25A0F|nr:Helix-turn-helix [Peptostreptococcus sp. D1]
MNNIKLIREKLNMSQLELAESLGISGPRLSQYENNKRKLPIEIACKISEKYQIKLDDIYNISKI